MTHEIDAGLREHLEVAQRVEPVMQAAEVARTRAPFRDAAERTVAAGWSSAQRQAWINEILVRYPTFNDALTDVGSFHMPVKGGVHDRGKICGLLGDSRAGKSTAIKHYIRGLGDVDRSDVKVPKAIYVDAIKGMNANAFADTLYAKLGLRRKSRGAASQHLSTIADEIAMTGVELVVIDDAQWLLTSNFSRTIGDTLGFIVDTAERGTCNIVLSGTREVQNVVEAFPHAVGRGGFPHEFVEPFDWYTPDGRKAFRVLLNTIGTYLPFKDLPHFADERISAHFYKVSGGLIGRVMNYVSDAAHMAINDGAFTVEVKHLQWAASRRRKLNDPFEPFVSSIDIDDPGDVINDEDEEAANDGEAMSESDLRGTLAKKRSRSASTFKGRMKTARGDGRGRS